MNANNFSTDSATYQQPSHQYLIQGNYQKVANFYEQAIEIEPEIKSNYWYLGLTLLLQGQEEEAQTTWFVALADGEPEEIELWTAELMQVLQTEAQRRESIADYSVAWAIRQHIREINPADINNVLNLIKLAINLEIFTGEELTEFGVIELLESEQSVELDTDLLLNVLQRVLASAPSHPSALKFAEACPPYVKKPKTFLRIIVTAAIESAYSANQRELAIDLLKLCLRLESENITVLQHLAGVYHSSANFSKSIETAKFCFSKSQTLPDKIFANYLVIRSLMKSGGYWDEVNVIFQQHISLLLSLIREPPQSFNEDTALYVLNSLFPLPYIRDDINNNRAIQNQVAEISQSHLQIYAREQVERYSQRLLPSPRINDNARPLKIGYVSWCLREHSVGWLARWIFKYQDHDRFQSHLYLVNSQKTKDSLQSWYTKQVNKAYACQTEFLDIADKIYQDEIDILVDLDSSTMDVTCGVMALKPAPIQVTWLGWDASGLPAIDYFIADPYVLPDSAQDYYSQKIWRLPQTYIAVDGFEIDVPTLRRDQLDIPSDAVVYLSAQSGFKRHPDTVRLQMKIIKEVPNSYFLIKGLSDLEVVKNFFNQIAEEEGVNIDRLRFLPLVESEEIHRANLSIADIVLDTYPYNGATTTLETLWMCIPLVTRVGQQFAARNSYTMMMNVGVTEGIAWTDEEYIEWGVRLGNDEALRQQITWKLRQSRQTSPLWNAKQFTREMEKAYQQMWQRYIESV
ncbi:MAG TPA: O-linked N-acetylglucosamine transferase, SPINDLY family protein [Cyanobacteria bacterium UBA11162]|nr:O-linked N-acetylglucosamine transferase, SPINDLY family protein [Cyanobacteria bacterium UBA11162]